MAIEIKVPKKLIEVALPLDSINIAAAYEKMPGIGPHPRGVHHWWARRPMAAARAIIFAQLVNDPGFERGLKRGVNRKSAEIERKRLLDIVSRLADWKNSNDQELMREAYNEILKSWKETRELNKKHPEYNKYFSEESPPALIDPFAGGGAIPLEASRLGLTSFASDLNPVAVLINKVLIEAPNRFDLQKCIYEESSINNTLESNSIGFITNDFVSYGKLVRENVLKKTSKYYPEFEITENLIENNKELAKYKGRKLNVIAWLWARTVKSPNPAYSSVEIPLISSTCLSKKKENETWLDFEIDPKTNSYKFKVLVNKKPKYKETINRKGGVCIMSGAPFGFDYIREEGRAGRIGHKLFCCVLEGDRERVYVPFNEDFPTYQGNLIPSWKPDIEFFDKALGFRVGGYGFKYWSDLFSDRQLFTISSFSEEIRNVHEIIKKDALRNNLDDDNVSFESGGSGATAYADLISLLLTFVLDRCTDFNNSVTGWRAGNQKIMNLFSKQTIPMVWDFAEANILGNVVGSFLTNLEYQAKCLRTLPVTHNQGQSSQGDAQSSSILEQKIISTDPPYYDNIGYADLSDFFYVWIRNTLKTYFPQTLSTITVPKLEELVATPVRHGNKKEAESFFLDGMSKALQNFYEKSHPAYPVTIYYAFKQAEVKKDKTVTSSGWETFLSAVIESGYEISGTWPLRSEQEFRMRGIGSNALASSIVLVCRRRPRDATTISRRQFVRELNSALESALLDMTTGGENSPVAPVDLSQAIIGPGMSIFSKYKAVLEADGSSMKISTALKLINRFISNDEFDGDTQFCLQWFETYGLDEEKYGTADVLARAKGTSVDGLREGGIAFSSSGKFRLLNWSEYEENWHPKTDSRISHWEMLHQLIKSLNTNGEHEAGKILSIIHESSDVLRILAYRLYTICERKKLNESAQVYNNVVLAWDSIEKTARDIGLTGTQASLFNDED